MPMRTLLVCTVALALVTISLCISEKDAYLSQECNGCGNVQAECCCVLKKDSILLDAYRTGAACLDVSTCKDDGGHCTQYKPKAAVSNTKTRLSAASVGLGALVIGGLGYAVANL